MLIKDLIKTIDIVGKRIFLKIFSLTFFIMILEIMGVAIVVPFIEIILGQSDQFIEKYNFLELEILNQSENFVIFAILTLIVFFIFKSLFSIFVNRSFVYTVYRTRTNVQKKILDNFIGQNLEAHLNKNSSKMINIINNEVNIFCTATFLSLINLATEILVTVGLVSLMAFYEPTAFLFFSISLILPIYVFYSYTKNKQKIFGMTREKYDELALKRLQQAMLGIREVKLTEKEEIFTKFYHDDISQSANSIAGNLAWTAYTRIFLEFLIVASISLLTFFIFSKDSSTGTSLISTLGLFAVAVFRILPSLTRIINSLQSITFGNNSLNTVHKSLQELKFFNTTKYLNIKFKDTLSLNDLSFGYENNKNVLENVSLEINKGELVGIIGPSGSGKSTLVDIISGLLKPIDGKITIDNKILGKYEKIHCGYVSQNVFLIDDTIQKNIAFGEMDNEINVNRVNQAVRESQLEEFIKKLPEGLNTIVGEQGTKISGGQKQRIGIARALYSDASLLIFDESTNALDSKTEKEFFNTILQMKKMKTIIFISHKNIFMEYFDKIYQIKNNTVELSRN